MSDPNTERDALISRMTQAISKPADKPAKPASKPMTAEEVRSKIEELARSGEGADQRWALRTLHGEAAGGVTLTPPMNDEEFVERGARMLRCGTPHQAQLMYRKAFPRTRRGETIAPRLLVRDLPEHIREKASRCRTIKQLYHDCPGLKRSGTPPGYPQKGTIMEQEEWCQSAAADYFLWEEQKKLDETPGPGDPTA